MTLHIFPDTKFYLNTLLSILSCHMFRLFLTCFSYLDIICCKNIHLYTYLKVFFSLSCACVSEFCVLVFFLCVLSCFALFCCVFREKCIKYFFKSTHWSWHSQILLIWSKSDFIIVFLEEFWEKKSVSSEGKLKLTTI